MSKLIVETQLRYAEQAIARARSDNAVTVDVGDALLALHTAVKALAEMEATGPRLGQHLM